MALEIDGDVHPVRTERTVLRPWRAGDFESFARLNADLEVMRFFAAPLPRAESDALAMRLSDHVNQHGYGFWALEIPGVADFAGFVGLMPVPFGAAFTPAIEIGWRLDRAYWGRGYATEAARRCLRVGFGALRLAEIVAYTVPDNVRSRAVMTQIGMVHDPASDFDHPRVRCGHPLRRHVLYRLAAQR